ncbi:proline--tRNA ligase [Neorickettsia risticii]|uniref:Proline--tRNA ligase n=1 Tax=Neorickettsia risticii (strain Illinois) TaxID=434131 RepID=C6V4M2_NEORI|nr:proline--tRNA ligase [Neorickettsia risticii]ACT69349.1 prolyl-tRNA synthetase [Neorickettsia risticii str. Illinois]
MKNKARVSEYYLPLMKNVSGEVKLRSHKYSLRAGLVKQCGAGLYSWLPLGLKVLKNIESIIRQELDSMGMHEMLMPCIQLAKLWEESGRYSDYGRELLKFKDRHDNELLFGPTNEEVITAIVRDDLASYKQLPKILYHIQWKFRDEIRPRFGLMRAREFLMKDAYSFDVDQQSARISYNKVYQSYLRIFKRLGLNPIPCRANAGVIGGSLNHEFHITTTEGGEGKIFYPEEIGELVDEFCKIDPSDEHAVSVMTAKLQELSCFTEECNSSSIEDDNRICAAQGIEVGHIFLFGEKYSAPMQARFSDRDGMKKNFYMGSYGIGISRLLAAIIEVYSDDKGIIWPESIAPFKVGLINLHEESCGLAEEIFSKLDSVIYDDTTDSQGVKFARMDLIGVPFQIIVGKNAIIDGTVELKCRLDSKRESCNFNELISGFRYT